MAHVSTAAALGRRLYGCSKKFDDIRWNEQRAEQRRTFAIFQLVGRSSGIHVRAEKRASNFTRRNRARLDDNPLGACWKPSQNFGSTSLPSGLRRWLSGMREEG
jgi:hypothetical protein